MLITRNIRVRGHNKGWGARLGHCCGYRSDSRSQLPGSGSIRMHFNLVFTMEYSDSWLGEVTPQPGHWNTMTRLLCEAVRQVFIVVLVVMAYHLQLPE